MSQDPIKPLALDEIAWKIFLDEDSAPVVIGDLDQHPALLTAIKDGRLIEENHAVRFSEELDMARSAAEYYIRTESEHVLVSPRVCFEKLHEVSQKEIGNEYHVNGFVLAELHNTGQLDGFSWAQQAIKAGVDVFSVQEVMGDAYPLFISAHSQEIYDFFTETHEQVKNDFAGGYLYNTLPQWLAKFPDIARSLMEMHEASPKKKSANLYARALHGLIMAQFDDGFTLTLKAARSGISMVSGPALHTLGLINYGDPLHTEALKEVIELCTEIIRTPGHTQIGTATRTLGRLVTLEDTQIPLLLDEAIKTGDPEAMLAASEVLASAQKSLRERDWFWPLYLHQATAKAEHKEVIDNIDMVLGIWIRDSKWHNKVLEFLDHWISNQPNEIIRNKEFERLFDSTAHNLKMQPEALNRFISAWFLSDDIRHPVVAASLISSLHNEESKLLALTAATISNLPLNEIRFLIRRILGFVVGDEAQIRLIFSLVKIPNAKIHSLGLVMEALKNHVGYDYPHTTIDYLKEREAVESDVDIIALCRDVISALETHLAALNTLPWLKELSAPSAKTHRFEKERWKQMNKAFEEARKDSIWYQLTSHVVLKAGRRTFQNIQGQYRDPMELKEYSHSIAIPRSEISDPAGAALTRYHFRTATKDTK